MQNTKAKDTRFKLRIKRASSECGEGERV